MHRLFNKDLLEHLRAEMEQSARKIRNPSPNTSPSRICNGLFDSIKVLVSWVHH